MEHLNKRKPNLLFFWFLLPFLLYGGYAVGKLEGEQITIENIRDMVLYSLTHPWPLRFTVLTIKAVLILLLIWVFAVIWYVGNYRSLIPGLEYGSAKFADPERVNEKLEDTDETKNKILSENIRTSLRTTEGSSKNPMSFLIWKRHRTDCIRSPLNMADICLSMRAVRQKSFRPLTRLG